MGTEWALSGHCVGTVVGELAENFPAKVLAMSEQIKRSDQNRDQSQVSRLVLHSAFDLGKSLLKMRRPRTV